jgi:hypothetical protein
MRLHSAIPAAVCLVVVIAAVAYAAGKTGPPEVVRAQKFELVDPQGLTRATLGPWADGTSGLNLMDVDGNRVAVLAVDTDGSTGLVLTDKDLEAAVKAVVVRGKPGLKLRVQDEVIWEAP